MHDPTQPITVENWPENLRLPPKRKSEPTLIPVKKPSKPLPVKQDAIDDGPFHHVLWSDQ
jgi:hypothetical protein